MVKVLEVSEFELQSRYYVHFPTNTPKKCINTFKIVSFLFLWKDVFDIK